ncbi:MAG: SIMPL domain-containing protein [bacterium]
METPTPKPFYSHSWLNAVIFALAICTASWMLSSTWRKTHETKETIKVTGLAEKNFVSDLIVWSGSFSRKMMSMQDAFAALKRDADAIEKYLITKGVSQKEIVLSAISINKEYKNTYDDKGRIKDTYFDGYTLRQSVDIESKEVDKIETMSREVTELINSGIEFNSEPPRYYYTKLAELKLEMLAAATADAKARGERIAKNSGGSLGTLRNAAMGIFQITGQNSSEEFSYGGNFNTSSKKKTASITARLEFGID